MDCLAVCAIVRDETATLREWALHHLLLGAERLIVYDNESAVPVAETLADLVEAGACHVREIRGRNRQLDVYAGCLEEFGPRARWLAFIDADEFLIPLDPPDLPRLLADYDGYGGLGANWVCFGSEGHLTRPGGLQLKRYTQRWPLAHTFNLHVKSIVRPDRVAAPNTAHHFTFRPGWHCVDEEGTPLFDAFSPFKADRLRVHHYFFRSQREYEEKLARGPADYSAPKKYDLFYEQARTAVRTDMTAEPFAEAVARAMRPAAALELAAKAVAARRESEGEALARAEGLLRKNNVIEAEREASVAATRFQSAQAWALAAACRRVLGRPAKAMEAIRRSMAVKPVSRAAYELFRHHLDAGRHDRAASTLAVLRRTADVAEAGALERLAGDMRAELERARKR
ncbi:glycosyltransferase family 2 protein [Desulfohalovibrio reitneri]|uniref:glycosyltransferase family 2 protein n=1 Tax=Desulfohalovibrio reitneri TaxID=1307759 RepID=UPI000690FA58|nr:glycosyltransferase family 2 protein [Desulfohalovibrio reitneri]